VNRPHGAARGRDSLCCPAAPARLTGIHGPSTDWMSRQNDLRSVIRESQPGTGVPSSLLGARFGWHFFREAQVRSSGTLHRVFLLAGSGTGIITG
jgi:hypothetical protein